MSRIRTWYPLSHGQEALWFLWELVPGSWAYNTVLAVGVRGELDVAALRRSLEKLYDRHPCLCMEFSAAGGPPRQRTLVPCRFELEEVDASAWSAQRLDEALRERAQRPFDLAGSAAMRSTLLRRGRDFHTLIFVGHHIFSDLWSFIVLMDELRELYPAEKEGRECRLPPLPTTYEDHVRRQRRALEGEAGQRLWEDWKKELAGELPVLDLPTDRSRPALQSFRGATVTRRLDAALTGQLKHLAGSGGGTLFMALLAAYQVLLNRYTGQEDLVVGSPTSGRQQADLAGVVGDFVNMVPLRADLSGNPTFGQLFERTRIRVVRALSRQDYPFSLLVDRLQPARDLSRSPIFQTSFVLQKFHRFEELSRVMLAAEDEPPIPFGELILVPVPLAQQEGQFDLHLEMKEDDQGRLMGAFKYAADLFDDGTIRRMSGHFETLLREIAAHPGCSLGELCLLTAAESREVVARGQGAPAEPPAAGTVCQLFEAQLARRGGDVAVRCGEQAWTYAELGARVDGLARGLVELGVGRGVLVALLLPRGLDFVALLLAVAKAGGAFLPLDPRHPAFRTGRILESSGTSLVVTSGPAARDAADAVAGLPEARRPRVARLEDLPAGLAPASLPAVDGADLAYMMYTSGSTGRPKGVMVEHRGMVNHVLGKLADLGMGADDVLAQNGPQSFDIVVWQCLAPLVVGGRVEVFPDEVAEDPEAIVAAVEERAVSVLQVVPSMLLAVLEELAARATALPELAALRWVVPTGEALPTELCRRWLGLYPHVPMLNTYGSTECSDDQCHYPLRRLEPADEAVAVVSIGTPIRNLSAQVLDGRLAPVPVGVVGELYVGGAGVGRGYYEDPARTAAAFLPDPCGQAPGARSYRTRDLARRRADGNLDFLGRVDHMIKLQGFRIEPKEIEAALCRHPAISEAAVLARTHPSGERRLVGYAVPAVQGPEAASHLRGLRQFLTDHLPQYMVPATVLFLNALPLTENGKLDLRRLPAPQWQADSSEPFVVPRTPTEKTMAQIWAEVLGREQVGATEDFFAIGGDSIRSIQIVARSKRAGLSLRPSDLFQHPTVAALAALADRNAQSCDGAAEEALAFPQLSEEHLELAFGQVEFE